ncbi:MAG: hypothetical protein ACNA8P_05670 [Phycisphaerales bacterium]
MGNAFCLDGIGSFGFLECSMYAETLERVPPVPVMGVRMKKPP